MNTIIRDDGFHRDDWTDGFSDFGNQPAPAGHGLDVPPDTAPKALAPFLQGTAMIRVDSPNFADGRGFTIARHLRLMGYRGRLRARGHIIADQYAMARRAGFDEIEISPELAARQPQEQWLFRANWHAHDYQSRLRAAL